MLRKGQTFQDLQDARCGQVPLLVRCAEANTAADATRKLGREARSSIGYPVMAISPTARMSAPDAAASCAAATIWSALPRRSPTTGLVWPSAKRRVGIASSLIAVGEAPR